MASVIGTDRMPHGLTVNSFTSVSLDPPLILFCVDYASNVLPHFQASKYFAINILAENQQNLSNHFARKGHDRFDGLPWSPGAHGAPLLPGVLAQVECEVYNRIPLGDHEVIVGYVQDFRCHEGRPLLYFASAYQKLAE